MNVSLQEVDEFSLTAIREHHLQYKLRIVGKKSSYFFTIPST